MHFRKIGFTFLALLNVTGSTPFTLNFPTPLGVSQVLAQSLDAQKAEADRLLEQGIQQHKSRGNFLQQNAAFQSLEQALKIYQTLKDRQGEARALEYLGALNTEHDVGIKYHEQWLAIARELKDRQMEGRALGALGRDYYYFARINSAYYDSPSNYAKGIEYFQQSLAISRQIKDRPTESYALDGIAQVYLDLGDSAKSVEYFQQLLMLARQIKDRQLEEYALHELREVYFRTGNSTKEIESYEQLLVLARESNDRQGEIIAITRLSEAYFRTGNYAKAIEYSQQDLALRQVAKERKNEAVVLGNLATDYAHLGNYDKALEYAQQALAIAREIKDQLIELQTLDRLREIYGSLGNHTKVTEYAQQAVMIARERESKEIEWGALLALGAALYKEGNFAAAEKTLIDGIKVAESLRTNTFAPIKVLYLDEQANLYSLLQKVLIAQNQFEAALEIAERGRGRTFADLLARQLAPKRALTFLQQLPPIESPTIQQIKQIAKNQNSTFVEYSIISDEFQVQGRQQTRESELYIWVVKPTGEIAFRRTDLKPLWQQQTTTLAELVVKSRKSIGVVGRGGLGAEPTDEASHTKNLQELHQILIQQIADLLPTKPNASVVFIPQSSLFLVPFTALQDKEGKYLIEKHTILTTPSIQVLELTHQIGERRRRREGEIDSGESLVVGNPTMPSFPSVPGQPSQQLSALPATEEEARAIATLLKTQPLIGDQATKTVVIQRMPSARIIHLATHGILDFKELYGAIALAPSGTGRDLSSDERWNFERRTLSNPGRDNSNVYRELELASLQNNNGFLSADDIQGLKLNAELVVLSACDTGVGKITADGVIGLSRSFIAAGVPSVVVSLWSVPDAPTAFLMMEFYKNLQHDSDKAQALRQAMLTTMKQHPNPRNWAAFTLVGEVK